MRYGWYTGIEMKRSPIESKISGDSKIIDTQNIYYKETNFFWLFPLFSEMERNKELEKGNSLKINKYYYIGKLNKYREN